ncbi:MAG: AAA family ATPase, partial [Deltaproteobacteria bacterium]|nr:AAA family ATPase [Deltaproteobacteria bacterium]
MKKLPLSMSSFQNVINQEAIYVDKTDLIAELIKYDQLFLSRPRRFGKTLLLDTLEALFRGQAELFAALKIAQSGYDFKTYPVLRLDMSLGSSSPDILLTNLCGTLKMIGNSEGKKKFE